MRSLAVVILYSSLLFSCNSNKQQDSPKNDQPEADTAAHDVPLQEPAEEHPFANSNEGVNIQALENHVFLIGRAEDFDEGDCLIAPACDCCSSELYFLPSDRFAYVSMCIEETTYFSGHYSADSTKIILTYDSRYIIESMDYELEEKQGDLGFKSFQIEDCQGRMHLFDKTNANATHGLRFKSHIERKYLQILFDSKSWKQLSQ